MGPKSWRNDYQPFCIAGSLYYVGTEDLGCYLITSAKGHILINTGTASSVELIRLHIATLGFKFSDLRILLTTQVHFDHVGGMAKIKTMTGASMQVHEGDASVLADGGHSDYFMGGKGALFTPVKADKLLRDKDTIILGDARVVLLHHPGHTKGASSFIVDVKDKERSYRVLIANMPSIVFETRATAETNYPGIAKDYAYTLDAMKHLEFDLWVASHAGQFDLHTKHKPGDAYNPQAFMDREGYSRELEELRQDYLKRFGEK